MPNNINLVFRLNRSTTEIRREAPVWENKEAIVNDHASRVEMCHVKRKHIFIAIVEIQRNRTV